MEEKYQQLTEVEKEEAIGLTVSQKEIRQEIEGLSRMQLQTKRHKRYIEEKEKK